MSTTFFISDHHLGHNNILRFIPNRLGCTEIEKHNQLLIDRHNEVVHKRDTVYFLGDVAFNTQSLERVSFMAGKKILILGNHDKSGRDLLPKLFCKIHGVIKLDSKYWLTHMPIHKGELTKFSNEFNIHGHLHTHTIPDPRYLNVCVDQLQGYPVPFDIVKDIFRIELEEYLAQQAL